MATSQCFTSDTSLLVVLASLFGLFTRKSSELLNGQKHEIKRFYLRAVWVDFVSLQMLCVRHESELEKGGKPPRLTKHA